MMLYRLVRKALFRLDPELAHSLALRFAGTAKLPGVYFLLSRFVFANPSAALATTVAGMPSRSPVWIAAGLDKDCSAVEALMATGVGAVELGTVTLRPQPGNDRPRMFRFPESASLVNRLGFPSVGVEEFVRRIAKVRRRDCLVGVNIGKNKDTPLESCEADYGSVARMVAPYADYLVINVSSPNTPGLRGLQSPEMLARVIAATQCASHGSRPIFVKLSPDCDASQLSEIVDCCVDQKIQGVITTNTTISRPDGWTSSESGGLSGRPLFSVSQQALNYVMKRRKEREAENCLAVIGCGGIEDSTQVAQSLAAGCAAVQLYTALVFHGPGLVARLNKELDLLNKSRSL